MIIRRARGSDLKEAARIYLESRKSSVPAIPMPVHRDDQVLRWFSGSLVAESELWIAIDVDAIVGVMALSERMLEQLYVAPSHTGRGIGSQLLSTAISSRPDGLELWTFQSNSGARRFYERHGFVAVEWGDGSGNEEKAPDVRYFRPGAATTRCC